MNVEVIDREHFSYIEKARVAIYGLPDTNFGIFSSSLDLLIALLAFKLYREANANVLHLQDWMEDVDSDLDKDLSITIRSSIDALHQMMNNQLPDRMMALVEWNEKHWNAISELTMWERRLQLPNAQFEKMINESDEEDASNAEYRIFLLDNLVEHPEYLPYFENDISDVGMIAKYLEDDIDVSMAKSIR